MLAARTGLHPQYIVPLVMVAPIDNRTMCAGEGEWVKKAQVMLKTVHNVRDRIDPSDDFFLGIFLAPFNPSPEFPPGLLSSTPPREESKGRIAS